VSMANVIAVLGVVVGIAAVVVAVFYGIRALRPPKRLTCIHSERKGPIFGVSRWWSPWSGDA
jgi:hypothetical protein